MTITTALLICLFGAVGACFRFGLTQVTNRLLPDVKIPVATLFINWIGASALGLLAGRYSPTSLTWLLGSGLLGGFTTFSTFTNETIILFKTRTHLAIGYLCLSVIGGIGLAALCNWLA